MKKKYLKPTITTVTVELEEGIAKGSDFNGNNGNNGKGWGHRKDDPDFPGNNGRGNNGDW